MFVSHRLTFPVSIEDSVSQAQFHFQKKTTNRTFVSVGIVRETESFFSSTKPKLTVPFSTLHKEVLEAHLQAVQMDTQMIDADLQVSTVSGDGATGPLATLQRTQSAYVRVK